MTELTERELSILKMNNHYAMSELQHCVSKALLNPDISEGMMETIQFNHDLLNEMYAITDKIELMIQEKHDEELK
jgi:hypothetical protein